MDSERKEHPVSAGPGVSRRGFITSVSTGAIGAAAAAGLTTPAQAQAPPPAVVGGDQFSTITVTVNGRRHQVLVESRWSLLYVLRDRLGLSGTKVGCERGECGACTVLIDSEPRLACITLAVRCDGQSVETIESLAVHGRMSRLQQAFHEKLGTQCGFCTPGMIMAAEALLRRNAAPDELQVRQALSGNLCRCTGYVKIIEAVQAASGSACTRTAGQ